ncbi:PGAP1 family protein [Cardiosporidium cionae]|uniref:GPI inositol-deacylase n=1 Tax=Cardiosporidium cionae TaxID=476202 RepID=A0ABQ7JE45_9APIC|nr:PGAP1 family protein [Cardiosporidium cionae]|eukprot:KAF8822291.1 PGAP1 family protein [Cardiosporidium cionae]
MTEICDTSWTGIYIFHSPREPSEIAADIIFIHGLRGNAWKSWRLSQKQSSILLQTDSNRITKQHIDNANTLLSNVRGRQELEKRIAEVEERLFYTGNRSDSYQSEFFHWPAEFLPIDFPECRVLAVDYPAAAFGKSSVRKARSTKAIATADLKKFRNVTCFPQMYSKGQKTENRNTINFQEKVVSKHFEALHSCSNKSHSDFKVERPSPRQNEISIVDLSQLILDEIRSVGIGEGSQPVVFVTHSLGGIIAKTMLQLDEQLLKKTRGIVFYGVPHLGSPVRLPKWVSQMLSRVAVELLEGNPFLYSLQRSFLNSAKKYGIRVLSFVESKRSRLLHNVFRRNQIIAPFFSSDPEIGEVFQLGDADHSDICKPVCRIGDIRYTALQNLIKNILQDNEIKSQY